jgi:predicted Zn-dependent peptidase
LTVLFLNGRSRQRRRATIETITVLKENRNCIASKVKRLLKRPLFYIGAPGVSRNNPDYVAIEVVNTLDDLRLMLNDELRVNSGLTYGANVDLILLKNGGSFVINTFTAEKTTEPISIKP